MVIQPTNITFSTRYVMSDNLANSSNPSIRYTGFVDQSKNWYIMEQNVTNGTYRYAKGNHPETTYTTNWSNRESLTYKYFYELD